MKSPLYVFLVFLFLVFSILLSCEEDIESDILIYTDDRDVYTKDSIEFDFHEVYDLNNPFDVQQDVYDLSLDIETGLIDLIVEDVNENGDIFDYGDSNYISSKRGFPSGFPWVSFYGSANGVDLNRVASYFRIINIDADPDIGNFTDEQIEQLKNGGKNRVISYLNVGSCENWRSYYKNNPPGFKSCVNSGALTTVYSTEYPDEKWADLSNQDYQDLIVNYVAKRLADRGVDGFFLDNMEVVEHGPNAKYGPCDSRCSQGGLDLVYKLREKFPDKLIVMQNATSDITLNGYTNGIWYPLLLDGISHEEVYSNGGDPEALSQMKKWRDKRLFVNGFPFWLGVEEYIGKCDSAHKSEALSLYNKATSDGFNAYVTDKSSGQQSPCFWE